MLMRMSLEQVSKEWECIKAALKKSVTPLVDIENEHRLTNILVAIQKGDMTVWASTDDLGQIYTLFILKIGKDAISGTKGLLVYSAAILRKGPPDIYTEAVKGVRDWAKSRGCEYIAMYVANPLLVELFKKYGGVADYTLVTFPLEET